MALKRKVDDAGIAPRPKTPAKKQAVAVGTEAEEEFNDMSSQSSALTELEKTPEASSFLNALNTDVDTPVQQNAFVRRSTRTTAKPILFGAPEATASATADIDMRYVSMLVEAIDDTYTPRPALKKKAARKSSGGQDGPLMLSVLDVPRAMGEQMALDDAQRTGAKRKWASAKPRDTAAADDEQKTETKQKCAPAKPRATVTAGPRKATPARAATPRKARVKAAVPPSATDMPQSAFSMAQSVPSMPQPAFGVTQHASGTPQLTFGMPQPAFGMPSPASASQTHGQWPDMGKNPNPAASLPSPPKSDPSPGPEPETTDRDRLVVLSQLLCQREPIGRKPKPLRSPEVWATGRQALCETLPYFKSSKSGCYMKEGNIFAMLFDGTSQAREYASANVIIARSGGHMGNDDSSGSSSQTSNHDIHDAQPQAFLNNIAQKNPVVLIFGNKNSALEAGMPERYQVGGWYKPTHMWVEKTKPKKTIRHTVMYRFERLDTSETPWFGLAPGTALIRKEDITLRENACKSCDKTFTQVYLEGWMCLHANCPQFWKLPNGEDAPYGKLDHHPAFLVPQVFWEREKAPKSVNPGVPEIGQLMGDNLRYVNTRGIVCPKCGKCNPRYLFRGWKCDNPGCDWSLTPDHKVVMPQNLHHTPWDMQSDGPSMIKVAIKPVVKTQVKHFHNYKVHRYTFARINGSLIVAKANKTITSQLGGADDMFRELQISEFGLERRLFRQPAATPTEAQIATGTKRRKLKAAQAKADPEVEEDNDSDDEDDDKHKTDPGARMTAFGMNFGAPYKFVASGDSMPFEEAPQAIRDARSLLTWAQKAFDANSSEAMEFNELLSFCYMNGGKINFHDDGEKGLGPIISTLSLGGAATMRLRVKAKYFSQVSNTGVFTYEEPLPLEILKASGYHPGFTTKTEKYPCKDTYDARSAAWEQLQRLKADRSPDFGKRSKELAKAIDLRRRKAEDLLSFHLTHGDIVIMEGDDIQKFCEHAVEPQDDLRYALTCRAVLDDHLKPEERANYEVKPDDGHYDGSALREEGDGDAVVWGS